MKLSDVMSKMALSTYAEVALLLFLGVFVAVVFQVCFSGRHHEAMRLLPLEDDEPDTLRPGRRGH